MPVGAHGCTLHINLPHTYKRMKTKRPFLRYGGAALALTALLVSVAAVASYPDDAPEAGALGGQHVEQADIVGGLMNFDAVRAAGERLFTARFNKFDGAGRPAATGGAAKRRPDQPAFTRISGPEANSCAGCHNQPVVGGSGEFVANVFLLAQRLDPVATSISDEFSNERNTMGMHGSGAIEMLAREMTADLQSQAASLPDGTHVLDTKGVKFRIKKASGKVIESEGVNTDLIVRPFFASGVMISLRQFSIDASNHHHGMQAEERFDLNPAKGFDSDFDEDGVHRELSVGDITAMTVWQASLPVPQQVLPAGSEAVARVRKGEKLFADMGCAACHKPELKLKSSIFSEPNPYNLPGTLNDTSKSFRWDMTKQGASPRLRGNKDGTVVVRAYTDLKRHNLCDPIDAPDPIRFYCNEKLAQDRPDQDGRPGTEYFITRKLWDVGSSAPYGHRGDITTLTEAILYHGGEARRSRDNFNALPNLSKKDVIDFLKTLQVVQDTTAPR